MAILYSVEVKMTSLIEKVVSYIAPHACIHCGDYNNILCDVCRLSQVTPLPSMCGLCEAATQDNEICVSCRAETPLRHMWAGAAYAGVLQKVLHQYKFSRAKDGYVPLVQVLDGVIPDGQWCVVPVPTAPSRVRQRGYDQAALLAKEVARKRGLPYQEALERVQSVRQVGANRVQRQTQSAKMFSINPKAKVNGVNILLIDDVCTTGATLNAAAHALRAAGADRIDGAVVAKALK